MDCRIWLFRLLSASVVPISLLIPLIEEELLWVPVWVPVEPVIPLVPEEPPWVPVEPVIPLVPEEPPWVPVEPVIPEEVPLFISEEPL
jgi:hypothetical protein